MKFFSARNLTGRTLEPCVPWEFNPAPSDFPSAQIRHDKQSRQEWYVTQGVQWSFYTALEPHNPNQRVSKENPARLLHGFVADYDVPIAEDRIAQALSAMARKPQWVESSLGGNIRLVWCLPRPITVDNTDFCCYILNRAVNWLQTGLLPGLDTGAFSDPARLFCNGARWRATGLPEISEAELQAFVVESGREFKFVNPDGVEIPLDVVEKSIREKFPNFSWPGEFSVDSQGPSFWIPESTSAMSAIVKKEGMLTFSAHAEKMFYPWADIVGSEVIKQFTESSVAKATADIWWDRKHFWRKKNGQYISCEMTELMNFFKVNCRLTNKPDKSGISMTDRALNHIWSEQSIHGAAPFCFRPHGIIDFQGKKVLNTFVNCAMRPVASEENVTWNDPRCRFLCSLFDNLFDPPTQLPHFLAWWKYFYTTAINETPAPGQNIFLMGGAGVGKTLAGRLIVGKSVGGFVDGSDYLIKNSGFNSEMYEVGLWCVDDETMGESSQAQANFQAMLKKVAANAEFKHNKKFEIPIMTEWMGRVICTTNLDYVSSRALGSLDNTSADKTNVFRCATESKLVFPSRLALPKIIENELPYFLRWLLDWTPPESVKTDVRYGYYRYHEPTLLNQAYQSSKVAPFKELLVEALQEYFVQIPEATEWRGTTTQLIRMLQVNPLNEALVRTLRLEQTTRYLELIQREDLLNCSVEMGPLRTRIWKFGRFVEAPVIPPAINVPQSTETNFSK